MVTHAGPLNMNSITVLKKLTQLWTSDMINFIIIIKLCALNIIAILWVELMD